MQAFRELFFDVWIGGALDERPRKTKEVYEPNDFFLWNKLQFSAVEFLNKNQQSELEWYNFVASWTEW